MLQQWRNEQLLLALKKKTKQKKLNRLQSACSLQFGARFPEAVEIFKGLKKRKLHFHARVSHLFQDTHARARAHAHTHRQHTRHETKVRKCVCARTRMMCPNRDTHQTPVNMSWCMCVHRNATANPYQWLFVAPQKSRRRIFVVYEEDNNRSLYVSNCTLAHTVTVASDVHQ